MNIDDEFLAFMRAAHKGVGKDTMQWAIMRTAFFAGMLSGIEAGALKHLGVCRQLMEFARRAEAGLEPGFENSSSRAA